MCLGCRGRYGTCGDGTDGEPLLVADNATFAVLQNSICPQQDICNTNTLAYTDLFLQYLGEEVKNGLKNARTASMPKTAKK